MAYQIMQVITFPIEKNQYFYSSFNIVQIPVNQLGIHQEKLHHYSC